MKALAFQQTDRIPKDLGGMGSTGVSCFAYPGLVAALGLPPRPPKVYDTGQMLALPDSDVLDALDCDVVHAGLDYTNAFEQPDIWRPYDFAGRLHAVVRDPSQFAVQDDGSILQPLDRRRMAAQGHVFDEDHGGQPVSLEGDIPKPDLDEVRDLLERQRLSADTILATREMLRRVRESTDRAVFFNGPGAGIGIANFTGIAMFPMLCLTEPEYVAELHELVVSHAISNVESLLAEIHPYIDIYQCCSDDWGTQLNLVASPDIFRQLFQPFYRRFTDTVHAANPDIKCFFHSCGAIYDLIDPIVDSGFDVLNPVQWTAGPHNYRAWKQKSHGRLALWGGGINAQHTLATGSLADIAHEARTVATALGAGGGYVFCAIHNLLAEISGEKMTTLYRAATSPRLV